MVNLLRNITAAAAASSISILNSAQTHLFDLTNSICTDLQTVQTFTQGTNVPAQQVCHDIRKPWILM